MYQDVATNMLGHELCFQTGTKTFNLNIASTEVYFLHDGVWSETQSCQRIPGFHWRPHFFKRMPLDIYFDILRDRRHPNLLRNLLKFYMSFFYEVLDENLGPPVNIFWNSNTNLKGLQWKSRASNYNVSPPKNISAVSKYLHYKSKYLQWKSSQGLK